MRRKIFDCITFFRENFITNLRFEILNDFVDYFVICESAYDHRNQPKDFNFKLENPKYFNKIIHIKMHDAFPTKINLWENQAIQRDFILKKLNREPNDYVMFSDPDEIPCPKLLNNINLKKKYGIFFQKHFVYKFNIKNQYENPWPGTRICQSKNLKSINEMRQNVLIKNLKKWWRPDKEKSIEIFENGGWHFNNFFSPKELSIKLKTFAHSEFSDKKFSDEAIIKKKMSALEDLYGRNQKFVKLNNSYMQELPEYVIVNKNNFKEFF